MPHMRRFMSSEPYTVPPSRMAEIGAAMDYYVRNSSPEVEKEWRVIESKPGLQTFQRTDPADPYGLPMLRHICTIENTTTEAVSLLVTLPDTRQLCFPRELYSHAITRHSAYTFYLRLAGFGWLVQARDVCGLTCIYRQSTENAITRIVQCSAKLPECPLDPNYVRATVTSAVWELEPVNDGKDVTISYFFKISLNGSMAISLSKYVVREQITNMGMLRDFVRDNGWAPYVVLLGETNGPQSRFGYLSFSMTNPHRELIFSIDRTVPDDVIPVRYDKRMYPNGVECLLSGTAAAQASITDDRAGSIHITLSHSARNQQLEVLVHAKPPPTQSSLHRRRRRGPRIAACRVGIRVIVVIKLEIDATPTQAPNRVLSGPQPCGDSGTSLLLSAKQNSNTSERRLRQHGSLPRRAVPQRRLLPRPIVPTFGHKELDSYGLYKYTLKDYGVMFTAGAICCTATHGAMTPIDVIKTTVQVNPKFKGMGILSGGRALVSAEGPSVLMTGFGPTAAGYLLQGGAKFAGYEFWKKQLVTYAGGSEAAIPHRTAIYLVGASIAEFFADILLTPLEAVRIRLVSERGYASSLSTGFVRMAKEGGLKQFYAGFIPILCKQIPYAVGQFTVNEWAHETVYKAMSKETQQNLSPAANGVITLGCGMTAGVAAAVLSHPADTLLSQINKGKGGSGSATSQLISMAKEVGFRGLWAGLGPRTVMTVGLVSGQFILYKYIKEALHAPPGVEIHKGE
ncbi:uncharacterized protein L969DRAFT_94916 [Mixia osmundae IAM 14324]|uniref:uncharacterized protein n=1 Tax=Mixia osmundae (strain CBS 9802 / IAM 14324 / JCM 22182 / KY 12970) TaxID=764103 RepID=UPI0004A54AE1|nr:uncharacterized protein L969DRAFT_94916 [Mixia osmundae IAM 14324]KEI38731.1 hypothetical protein L969DRAFT_94916 [Mixia osmundae IAM 14324]